MKNVFILLLFTNFMFVKAQYTDLNRLNQSTNEKLNNWLQKGEFEKTTDYENRISANSSSAFDSITSISIKDLISRKYYDYQLLEYDADEEKYLIKIDDNPLIKGYLMIPVDKAKNLKENKYNFKLAFNRCDWTTLNNSLVPNELYLENNKSNEKFPIQYLTSIKNTIDLELQPNLLAYFTKTNISLTNFKNVCEQNNILKEEQKIEGNFTARQVAEMAVYPGCEKFTGNKSNLQKCLSEKINEQMLSQLSNFGKFLESKGESVAITKLQFVINKSGKITSIQAMSGVENQINHEFGIECEKALRQLSNNLTITPAKLEDGSNVNLVFQLPVRYQIQN